MTFIHRAATITVLALGLAVPAAAQLNSSVSQADIQRLQDNVYLAERDVTQLRSRDATLATQLQAELEDLREEVIYLKVKLRKERSLARSEYAGVRDHIEDVRSRARGDNVSRNAPPPPAVAPSTSAPPSTSASSRSTQSTRSSGALQVPVNTEFDVRLQNSLNSGTTQVEERFEATTIEDVLVDGRTAIPAGALLRGVVSSVEPGTRTNRTARMTVSFDQITVNGRAYELRGTVTEAIKGEGIRGEAGRTAAGAIGGAVIGGLLGGVKGAILGTVIGGGGTVVATEGKEVELPQGTVLRVRLDSPLDLGSAR